MRFLPVLLLSLIGSSSAFAYKEPVHAVMTEHAFEQALKKRDYLTPLGLSLNTAYDGKILADWIADGAIHEDTCEASDLECRPLNHFYDPVNDRGLRYPAPFMFCPSVWLGSAAYHWGVGASLNSYNIYGAKLAYYRFLVAQTVAERNAEAALLFYSLGHIVHLIQDMAQPQHTRNDVHDERDCTGSA